MAGGVAMDDKQLVLFASDDGEVSLSVKPMGGRCG